MNARRIFLRADGSNRIGLGHLYRCMAIAEALSGNGELIFLTRKISEILKEEILTCCSSIEQLYEESFESEAERISKELTPDDIIVCDGYNFRTEYQLILKSSGCKVVCIDDICSYHFAADVIINHAGGIDSTSYSFEPNTRCYLGPAYTMVRSVFWDKPPRERDHNNQVFVCLGGADPNNDLVPLLMKALLLKDSFLYHVVTGSAYRFESELNLLLAEHKNAVKHHKNLNASEMKQLIQKCAVSICSPSTVSYEYLSVGGELYLFPIADNQLNIFNYFTQTGLGFSFENFGTTKIIDIKASRLLQDQIFDGKSYLRLREAILYG